MFSGLVSTLIGLSELNVVGQMDGSTASSTMSKVDIHMMRLINVGLLSAKLINGFSDLLGADFFIWADFSAIVLNKLGFL